MFEASRGFDAALKYYDRFVQSVQFESQQLLIAKNIPSGVTVLRAFLTFFGPRGIYRKPNSFETQNIERSNADNAEESSQEVLYHHLCGPSRWNLPFLLSQDARNVRN